MNGGEMTASTPRNGRDGLTAAINPRYRFYVRPGKSFEAPWVVVDRKINAVVAEYESRSAARDHVKEANRG
jgi:hypothetical protein